VHVVLIAVFLFLPGPFFKDDPPDPLEIVFYSPEELERLPEAPPELPEPEPLPDPQPEPEPVVEVPPVETPPPAPKPEPKPVRRVVQRQPEPAVEKPPVATPAKPARPKPTVRTEVFASEDSPEVEKATARRQARTAGFGDSEPTSSDPPQANPKRSAQTVGTFSDDTPVASPTTSGRREARVVANGSFSEPGMTVPAQEQPTRPQGVVTRNSFGSEEVADAPAPASRAPGEVNRGGFEDDAAPVRPATRRKRQVEEDSPDAPVEIVSKPRPVYTDEARDRRIEGEVVLEVVFVATGQLRVLRVLDGLGHGLDEAAVAAAKKIEFTPARRDGRPVDHTATLRVVFRLA
jgi:TonB family protein